MELNTFFGLVCKYIDKQNVKYSSKIFILEIFKLLSLQCYLLKKNTSLLYTLCYINYYCYSSDN